MQVTATEQRGDNLNNVHEFRTENASSQGQDLALTGLFVPDSLDGGEPPNFPLFEIKATASQTQPLCGCIQGYLACKKPPPRTTLQSDHA